MTKLTFLGTGTSHGIPVIGCRCPVCTSRDPKNNRTRASLLVEHHNSTFLIDTGQEFRIQAVRAGISHLDAVFYTHDHADHLYGIDDLRIFTRHQPLPVYGAEDTLDQIKHRFAYIFSGNLPGGGVPSLELNVIKNEGIVIDGLSIIPVPIYHGKRIIYGYRFGDAAYLTDCSGIPAARSISSI
jgi:phosphoribosyl 1,2-cyclic phosphate phosphodiesterase